MLNLERLKEQKGGIVKKNNMSQKQIKQSKKFTVGEVLASIEWSIEDGELILLSRLSDEFITLDMDAIIKQNE